MSTVVKASTASEFLGFIPKLLGYNPRESVVLVPFRDNRSIGAMRVNLPEAADLIQSARTIIGLICRVPDANSVAVIVYTSRSAEYATTVAEAVVHQSDAVCGMPVRDALFLAGDGWGSTMDGFGIRPRDTAPAEQPDLGFKLDGTALPEVTRARQTEALESSAKVEDSADLNDFIESMLEWDAPAITVEQAKIIHEMMLRPSVRDIALMQWAGGFEAGIYAADAQLAWENGVEYPQDLAMAMWGDGPRPEPARLEAALEVMRWATAVIANAGSYSVLAWLSWALGRSTHAEHYALAGQEIDEEHGLCQIVRSFITAGHLPSWAFERKSS